MIVPARRRAPRSQNYRTGVWSGLGAVATPVYEQCGFDPACIQRNNVKQEAYNLAVLSETRQKQLAFCLSDPGYSPAQCHAQFDPGGFQDQTANAGEAVRTTAAYSPLPVPNTIQPAAQHTVVNPLESRNAVPLSNVQLPIIPVSTVTAPLAPLPTTPQGQVIVTSSGVVTSNEVQSATGFDFSSVPWYIWVGGAVGAFLAFGGGNGR